MQIRFDKERLQKPTGDVTTPYIERLVQYWYKPCTIAGHNLPFSEVAPLGTEFERPLWFNENILPYMVDIDVILTPAEEEILKEGLKEFEEGKTVSLSDLKRERSEI